MPYAQDAGVTRHLAALLGRQAGATAELQGFAGQVDAVILHPTAVLFNGGVFKSEVLSSRTLAVLNSWLAAEGAAPARRLSGADMDLAVAHGAAYYGYVRRGKGVRIRGGTAQAFYVAVESSMPAIPGVEPPVQALCVAPFGMEEGTQTDLLDLELGLGPVVNRCTCVWLLGAAPGDAGTMLDFWQPDELQELGEIHATLPAEGRQAGDVVQVKLRAVALETGTLEPTAVASHSDEHWKVEFDVRRQQLILCTCNAECVTTSLALT